MAWRERRRLTAAGAVVAIALATIVAACSGDQKGNIGSQGDLDSIVASAGGGSTIDPSVSPIGTIGTGSVTGSGSVPGGAGASAGAGAGAGQGSGANAGGGSGNGSNGAGGNGSGSNGGGGSGSGSGAAGGAGGGGGGGDQGGEPPVVVDTSPDHPVTPFCLSLAEAFGHLNSQDYRGTAQGLVDDQELLDRVTSQAPAGGAEQVQSFIQVVHRLANGESINSALVTVPLSQFVDWAGGSCTFVR